MEFHITPFKHNGEELFYLSVPSDIDGKPLWLTKYKTLSRVTKQRGFLRSWESVSRAILAIERGEVREGGVKVEPPLRVY